MLLKLCFIFVLTLNGKEGVREKKNKSFHQAGLYMLSQLFCSGFKAEEKKTLKHKAVWIVWKT